MTTVSVVTPTGGRPVSFALCERWMTRQTRQPDQWIVVDDCDPATPVTMGQEVIRLKPRWTLGDRTLRRNLIAGLRAVRCDVVLIVEDDDWYCSVYIERMLEYFKLAPMVGEGYSAYYHVGMRRYRVNTNVKHASLFQTGFCASMIDDVCFVANQWKNDFIDMRIWAALHGRVFPRRNLSIGIKGLPGRGGIGKGHLGTNMTHDPDLEMLRTWIGDEDTEVYLDALNG